MVDDKYIGLALALSSSVAIGTSFIITKKGLIDTNERNANSAYASASDDLAYLRNPIWWAGISTLVLGESANFAAYTFAPPMLVTPLGALSVLIGAVLASFLLKEELGHIGRVGCTLCFIGALIIVLHAPEDKEIQTVDEILHFAIQPGFLMYCFTVLVFSLVMIYSVAPRYGKSNPLVYVSICSLVGSVSIMAVKGFGVAVKLTLGGSNQFSHPSTYVFGIVVILCILVQMNYLNKALDTFPTNVVNPIYYVGFTSATIVASIIMFQGFDTQDATSTVSLLAGFITTFLGVHLLNLSRKPDGTVLPLNGPLESVITRRLSITGRASLDGWGLGGVGNGNAVGLADIGPDGAPRSARHGRQSSMYRAQSSTLFNAFEEEEEGEHRLNGSGGLPRLREEDEEEDDNDDGVEADERTRLRTDRERRERERAHDRHRQASLGNGQSPHGSQGDLRNSVRQV